MKTRIVLAALVLGAAIFAWQRSHTTTPAVIAAEEASAVNIQVAGDYIDFLAGDKLIGRYQKGEMVAKPYFWPLNGPGGVVITRGWPMVEKDADTKDHLHQKSLWFCHGDIIPEGIEVKDKIKGIAGVDFWSENKGHGKIVCVEVGKPKVENTHGEVTTRNEWRTADGIKILDEVRTIGVHNYGNTRMLVFDIDLLASAANLTFGDTKEGSFGVRINDTIREAKGGGKLENADGKTTEKQVWGQLSPWCDYSGKIDGTVVGLAVFDDPKNPYAACWHARGYGLMAANPFGRSKSFPAMKENPNLVKLAKGEHLKFRYGVLIHPGDAKGGKVAEYYERFVKRAY